MAPPPSQLYQTYYRRHCRNRLLSVIESQDKELISMVGSMLECGFSYAVIFLPRVTLRSILTFASARLLWYDDLFQVLDAAGCCCRCSRHLRPRRLGDTTPNGVLGNG